MLKEIEDMKEIKKTMCEPNGNFNKEIKNPKRNQKGILEPKGTIIEMKNSLEGLKNWYELIEERTVNLKVDQ